MKLLKSLQIRNLVLKNRIMFPPMTTGYEELAKYDDNNFITGDVLAECSEENYGHADYHNKDNWDDFMNKCYEVLNVPCFSGKSFKDIIEDVVFES